MFSSSRRARIAARPAEQSVSKTRSQIVAKVETLSRAKSRSIPRAHELENVCSPRHRPRTTHQILEVGAAKTRSALPQHGADLKAELRISSLSLCALAVFQRGVLVCAGDSPSRYFRRGREWHGQTTTSASSRIGCDRMDAALYSPRATHFRAAAIEQLGVWASRTGAEIIKTKSGGDPAAVVYDALTSARARNATSSSWTRRGVAYEVKPDGRAR